MNHWIIAPIVLPAMMAPLIVLAMRHDLLLQRVFSAAASFVLLAISIGLIVHAAGNPPVVYQLGNWQAPFGIVLVLDRLSALMVLLTAILAVAVVIYAITSNWDKRGRHFHALFQFQLMGINGAFLTGDAFNLFVFFEVLLIASYGLMLHGGGAQRMKAGVQYVVVNLGGSTLFLIAIGTIYAITGTLNMADLAVKVPLVPEGDQALLRVGALLLLVVFSVKAALVPIHFWLPGTYANAPAPVAALFAVMTKVGAYSIIRIYTLAFGGMAGEDAWLAADWLLPAALVTLVIGSLGVLGAKQMTRLIAFSVIASMGTLLTAVSLFTPAATTAALFYLIHSTFAGAALFLINDLIVERRRQRRRPAGHRAAPGQRWPSGRAVLPGRHRHGRHAAADRLPGQADGDGQRPYLGLHGHDLGGDPGHLPAHDRRFCARRQHGVLEKRGDPGARGPAPRPSPGLPHRRGRCHAGRHGRPGGLRRSGLRLPGSHRGRALRSQRLPARGARPRRAGRTAIGRNAPRCSPACCPIPC